MFHLHKREIPNMHVDMNTKIITTGHSVLG